MLIPIACAGTQVFLILYVERLSSHIEEEREEKDIIRMNGGIYNVSLE